MPTDSLHIVTADSIPSPDSCLIRPAEDTSCCDSLICGDSSLTRPITLAEMVHASDSRIAGDAISFSFRGDDYVTGGILLLLFFTMLITARSSRYLRAAVGDFFQARHRENLFDDSVETEMRGRGFLVFQLCVTMGVLLFDFVQEEMPDVLHHVSPYWILGLNVTLCLLWMGLRLLLFHQVNRILFEREARRTWMDGLLLITIGQGLLLLPVTLLVVYFDLSYTYQRALVILICAIGEMLLFYKTFITFFKYRAGIVHNILYLCALEFIPLLILWRAIIWANTWLTTLH